MHLSDDPVANKPRCGDEFNLQIVLICCECANIAPTNSIF